MSITTYQKSKMTFPKFAKVLPIAASFCAALIAGQAQGAVIDFENTSGSMSANQSMELDGYRFALAGEWAFATIASPQETYLAGNGTRHLMGYNDARFDVSAVNGAAFDLFGFDGGESWNMTPHGWATSIVATGVTVAGVQVSQSFVLDLIKDPVHGFQAFTLNDGFRGLRSVSFNGVGGNPEFSLDNLRLQAAAEVPEPAGIALFGLGLAAVGFARRRKAAR